MLNDSACKIFVFWGIDFGEARAEYGDGASTGFDGFSVANSIDPTGESADDGASIGA